MFNSNRAWYQNILLTGIAQLNKFLSRLSNNYFINILSAIAMNIYATKPFKERIY